MNENEGEEEKGRSAEIEGGNERESLRVKMKERRRKEGVLK